MPEQLDSPDWQESWQEPKKQTSPLPHVTPPKQFPAAPHHSGSVSGLMQVPAHSTSPDGQDSLQMPLSQIWPGLHMYPQVPQFPRSVCRLRQMPEQLLSPAWQESEQVAPLQTWPAEQGPAHCPQ